MTDQRQAALTDLAKKLSPAAPISLDLLHRALIHPSYVQEHGGGTNQRLEFLGDAVVGLVMATYFYREYPGDDEGKLTQRRATVVCEEALAQAAGRLGIGDLMLFGRGESAHGGASRASNLADAMEAVCAAVYLSVGLAPLEDLLCRILAPELKKVAAGYYGDYKTRLQEYVQSHHQGQISYRLLESHGPDHDKHFKMEVWVDDECLGTGEGRSKKNAERAAAYEALVHFGLEAETDVL
ncbi:ribonuclease III [Peptococcus simiae]|uniref:Ribonuclease 3 n=1 Tax=Peptococcus simiae TaxID=1643805 RepID=A0ABW9H2Y2_9FIRM